MDSLLSYVYFEEHSPNGTDVVPVTLYQVLMEQQIQREWRSARPGVGDTVPVIHATRVIPEQELKQFAAAWDALRAVITARGVALHVGLWRPNGPWSRVRWHPHDP